MRRALALVTVAAAAALALALMLTRAPAQGQPAPALPHRALVGAPVTLSALHGRPAVIAFFASWCGPCVGEAPAMSRVADRLRGQAHLVAIDWSDSNRSGLAFARRFGWSFPVLSDPNGQAGYAYGIQGLPTAFVLDARGVIVRRLLGPQTTRELLGAVLRARGS